MFKSKFFYLLFILVLLSLIYLFYAGVEPSIIMDIRLPRLLSVLMIASILSASALLVQTLTLNPIAEMTTLGLAGGSSFALSLLLFLGISSSTIYSYSFSIIGAFLSLFLLILVNIKSRFQLIKLILSGSSLGLFLTSLATSLSFINHDSQSYVRWMAGSFSGVTWEKVIFLLIFLPLFFLPILFFSASISALSLGEELAQSLGVSLVKIRLLIIFLVAMATGISVAMVGVISFVGLISPHIAKRFEQKSFIKSLFFSNIIAMLLLLFSDFLAKTLFFPYEFPTGALTMIFGAGFLIFILLKSDMLEIKNEI
ncbi:MAG: FecCD family ABC transporter permease [Lactovum sp.]